jgi:dolichyl-phosphate-mannose-protein mannosyltransferase
LMLRPVAYFYRTAAIGEPISFDTPALPATTGKVIYDVHAMGNPVLWWLSTAAIFYMLWLVLRYSLSTQKFSLFPQVSDRQITDNWIILYLVLNWLANLLPWIPVTRCTFIYHYMGSSVFAGMAIAFIVNNCLQSYRSSIRILGLTTILLILLAFVFWMPVYLGLPLSLAEYRLRLPYFDYSQLPLWIKQWLPNWI